MMSKMMDVKMQVIQVFQEKQLIYGSVMRVEILRARLQVQQLEQMEITLLDLMKLVQLRFALILRSLI